MRESVHGEVKTETWTREKIESYLNSKYDMRRPTDKYGQPIKRSIVGRKAF